MILSRTLEWYDYLHDFLFNVNNILLILIGIAFTAQLFFIIFFFVKKTSFPKAKSYHKFAIIIPARNESEVIGRTVKELLTKQNYPKDKFDIYVVADNCTDNTDVVARSAGATVFIHHDDEPSHKRASYAIQYGMQEILKLDKDYECYIKFDADNLADSNFISVMNDAYEGGVECARCMENSSNINQNMTSKCSAIYYLRDCRLACRVRERVGLDKMINGAGMMFSARIAKEINGWDAMSTSDDAEFGILRLLDGERIHYVEDAIVYEDQSSTLKETWNRYVRIGHGLNHLFWKYGFRMLFKFLMTFRLSFLDLFLQLFFIPMAFLCCTWIPLFYVFDALYMGLWSPSAPNLDYLMTLLKVVILALVFLFYLAFVLQAFMVTLLNKKNIKDYKLKNFVSCWFIFPCCMIFDCITIFFGVITKPKWKKEKRNKT